MDEEYKYEVALSFLQQDEQLAIEMADRPRDRVKVFIYSEQQKELIANDGVDAFSQVFRKEARVVVILYREDWGQSRWTRIEETAIKNRYLDEGYKFLVVISLDGKHPVWYPDTWIWCDLQRYGIDGAASVIEARVREAGCKVRAESISDHAARIDREIGFSEDYRSWKFSTKGVADLKEEGKKFFGYLETLAQETGKGTSTQVGIEFRWGYALVSGDTMKFFARYGCKVLNTLEGAGLNVVSSEGGSFGEGLEIEPCAKSIEDVWYDLDWDKSGRLGWRERSEEKPFFTSAQLAEYWIRRLLNQLRDRAVPSD